MPSTSEPNRGGLADGGEPPAVGLGLVHEHGRSLRLTLDGAELARYVHRPWDVQLESPRPYLHPMRTLDGRLVSLYRPHDHVWHKGIAWSLPHVGRENLWGGPTFVRDEDGYVQLDNTGSMRHEGFDRLEVAGDEVTVVERLGWLTQQGDRLFDEIRTQRFALHRDERVWSLAFESRATNVSDQAIAMGSPTTAGRPNAGYGGLFWRGPRSFTGGRIHLPERSGGDELMGERAPWAAFVGRHDGHDGAATLTFVDAEDNPGHPVQWFVRSTPFACVCPAPFFSEEVDVAAGATMTWRYAVVVSDGNQHQAGAAEHADLGRRDLQRLAASLPEREDP